MELFELTKSMFENPQKYEDATKGDKKKHYFMVNRFMSINFPMQAHVLGTLKNNPAATVDFWQTFVRKLFKRTPHWMFIKGSVRKKKDKEKLTNISEEQILGYSTMHELDHKSVRDAIKFFPEKMKVEFKNYDKIVKQKITKS